MSARRPEQELQRLTAQVTSDAQKDKNGAVELTADQKVLAALAQGKSIKPDDLSLVHARILGLDITARADKTNQIDPSDTTRALTSAVSAAFEIQKKMGPAYETAGGKNPTVYLPLLEAHGIDTTPFRQTDQRGPQSGSIQPGAPGVQGGLYSRIR